MGYIVYTLKRFSDENLEELKTKLNKDMIEIDYISHEYIGDTEVLLLTGEKYYLRNNSVAAITIQCVKHGQNQMATIVSTGGGNGMFDDDWGANKNFANKAKTIMMQYGFEEVNNMPQAEET